MSSKSTTTAEKIKTVWNCAYYSHFTIAVFRQDGTHSPGPHCNDVSFATDDGRAQRRLKLPATQGHFRLSTSWFHFREKLKGKVLSYRVATTIS